MPGGGSNAAARELVQLLLEVHGVALQRLLEIVFESGPQGGAIIAKWAKTRSCGICFFSIRCILRILKRA